MDHSCIAPRIWMWERALDSRCGENDARGHPGIGIVNAIALDFRDSFLRQILTLPLSLPRIKTTIIFITNITSLTLDDSDSMSKGTTMLTMNYPARTG